MGASQKRASELASDAAPARPTEAAPIRAPEITDERGYLYEIIRTIGAGPDLDTILSGAVRLITEATKCHACLIWFAEGDRLVMRASSQPYAHLAGVLRMGADEGLAGWVARTRRSAFLKERALDDPRVKYFPELQEERFQSLVSVPMFERDGGVMGVISLHAEAPHEFGRRDLDFLEHTAWLMAGAVENARSYEESTARVALLTDLSRLSEGIAGSADVEQLLTLVASGARALLSASRCEIYLAAPNDQLRLAAADPRRVDAPVLPASGLPRDRFDRDGAAARSLARAISGAEIQGVPMVLPLVAGEDRIGCLAVLATEPPPPGAEIALEAVAAHAAVAIRRHELVERLLEKNLVRDFFAALSDRDAAPSVVGELAGKLGCDLDAPHVVVHVAAEAAADPVEPAESRLAAAFPAALFEHVGDELRSLIPVADGDAHRVAADILDAARAGAGMPSVSIGVSNVRRGADSYPSAFDEARAAAEVGSLLRGGPGVTTYPGLGAYRYVLDAVATGDDHDRRLERLVAYDRRRKAALLDTLERYLDNRGNLASTARRLYVHPNTLRQRLERIERETGIDLDAADWLSLAMAVKIVKLRSIRASRTGGGSDG